MRGAAAEHDLIGPNRARDVLHLLISDVVETYVDTPMHLFAHRAETQIPPGSANSSSRAATLTPSPAISLPSTMMSPKLMPIRNSMLRRAVRLIVCPHRSLHVDRATERGIRAAEFEQHPVTCSIDDPAVVFGNFGSTMRSRMFRSRANDPASSRSMCRLKPTTSAITIAASLRLTALRFMVIPAVIEGGEVRPVPQRPVRSRAGVGSRIRPGGPGGANPNGAHSRLSADRLLPGGANGGSESQAVANDGLLTAEGV